MGETESESQNHLSKGVSNHCFFSTFDSFNCELFGVEQQRYYVLKEQVVVFCSPLFGDISLKAHMPVRAGPGSPATLSGQTASSLVPRAL